MTLNRGSAEEDELRGVLCGVGGNCCDAVAAIAAAGLGDMAGYLRRCSEREISEKKKKGKESGQEGEMKEEEKRVRERGEKLKKKGQKCIDKHIHPLC